MKLPKGMFQRGNSYYVRLFGGGRDKWVSLGSDLEVARRSLDKLRAGAAPLPGATVKDIAARWLDSYVRTSRNAKGHALAKARVLMYLEPFMGNRKASKVTKEELRGYRVSLERSGMALQTVAHVLSDARCLFRWAEDEALIDGCPVPRKLLPRIQERPPDRLTDDEVDAVVGLPEPYGFICRFGLGTGLRWGEMTRAQVSDLSAGMLTVSHTKSRKIRRIPLADALREEMRGRIGRIVGLTHADSFNLQVRKLAGIEGFHVHQLRHTFACRWIEAGGSLAALQELLGHSSIVTTQRYARLSEAHVRAEADRIHGRIVASAVAARLQGTA